MNVFKMGWRNVWRNRRRSLVTIAAMTLALWVLLLYSGLIPGFLVSMEESITQIDLGDVQIHAPGFIDSPSLYTTLDESAEIVEKLEAEGVAASPRLVGGGLAAVGDASAGVSLRGLDVVRDARVSAIHQVVDRGQWLDPADPKGVVLGKLLARNLGAEPGDELLIVSQAADGSMANELYTVRGVLKGITQGTDRAAVLMNEAAFRELMVVPTGAHQIVLRRGDRDLEELADLTREIVRDPYEEILATLARGDLGQLVIQHQDYLEAHDPALTLEGTTALKALAEGEEHVSRALDRVLGPVTFSRGESQVTAALLAYDPAAEDATSLPLLGGTVQGALLTAADADALVLSAGLAVQLGASIGDELGYTLLDKQARTVTATGRLVGTVAAAPGAEEPPVLLLPIGTARQALGYGPGEASHISLLVDAPLNTGLAALTLSPKLTGKVEVIPAGAAVPGPDVRTWRDLMPAVAQMMDSVGGMIYIFAFIVYIAVAILILNAMLTAVFERIREFGVLKAIGAGPGRVMSLILVEGAVQTSVAMVLGFVLALPLMWYMQVHGFNAGILGGMDAAGVAMPEIWVGVYTPATCAGPIIMLWFISTGAVIYPAMKASWINPISAMRYGAGTQGPGQLITACILLAELSIPLVERAEGVLRLRAHPVSRALGTLLLRWPPALYRFAGRLLGLFTRPAGRQLSRILPWLADIAWRNLWRQPRRTILTLVSIAFGFFMAVFMMSMQDRSFSDFIDTAAQLGAGHVVVQHADYHDTPSLSRTVHATEALRAQAAADPRVEKVVERIMGEAMISTAHDSFGAAFIAYDPALEDDDTLHFVEGLTSGTWFDGADDKGIILGKTLAMNLGAELGDKIVYTLMDKDGEIVAGMGRLKGTIGTGAPSADAAIFLLPIDQARTTLGYGPDEVTQLGVYLEDNRDSTAVAESLGAKLDEGTAALAWSQVAPDLKAFVAMKKGGGRFFLLIIALLITAGIFNTLFMSVMERVREFGIQLAIGYTPSQIFRMIMWESVYLALVGLASGLAITAWPYTWLKENGIDMSAMYAGQDVSVGGVGFSMHMNCGIYDSSAIIIVCCIIFATLAAGLYPAWKAGKVEPVDTIKLV
ncbi:MAG: FtsX-like permease family protein [Pseudomonadota bacterium]